MFDSGEDHQLDTEGRRWNAQLRKEEDEKAAQAAASAGVGKAAPAAASAGAVEDAAGCSGLAMKAAV